MKVLITGATGLVGQEIVKLCHQSKIDVHYLTTRRDKLVSRDNYKGFYWSPTAREIDASCFEDVEVIIHLAGASVAERWTTKRKQEIIASRIDTTLLILDALKKTKNSVRHIVSASAIGIYPDSFQNYYKEDASEKETGFLGEVVTKWETAVEEFKVLPMDVSIVRIGLVLSEKGGAFPKIATPIKQGIGAVFGNGKQWQSWIHVEDLARLFIHLVQEEITGVFNAVAPNPVSNHRLTHVVADQMGKKIHLPNVPKFMMKLVLGEMHVLLFNSQRVSCDRIMETGFNFKYDNITKAVTALVK